MVKYLFISAVGVVGAAVTELASFESWGNLPAWAFIAGSFAVLLKFVIGNIDKKLDKMVGLLEQIKESLVGL